MRSSLMEFQEINFMLKLISFLTILWGIRCQGLDQIIWRHKELQIPDFKFEAVTESGYGNKLEYYICKQEIETCNSPSLLLHKS